MVLDWKHVQGTQSDRPLEIDKMASPSCVYIRKNITQVTVTETDGSTHAAWEYDEVALSLADYAEFEGLSEIVRTATEPQTSGISSQNNIIMGALAESYEQDMDIHASIYTLMGAVAELYETLVPEEVI